MQEFGERKRLVRYPLTHDQIFCALLFRNPLAHPTMMFRKGVLKDGAIRYRQSPVHAQDYELWARLLVQNRAANLDKVLVYHRRHRAQVTATDRELRLKAMLDVRIQIAEILGAPPAKSIGAPGQAIFWGFRIIEWNTHSQRFQPKILFPEIMKFLVREIKQAVFGAIVRRDYLRSAKAVKTRGCQEPREMKTEH